MRFLLFSKLGDFLSSTDTTNSKESNEATWIYDSKQSYVIKGDKGVILTASVNTGSPKIIKKG